MEPYFNGTNNLIHVAQDHGSPAIIKIDANVKAITLNAALFQFAGDLRRRRSLLQRHNFFNGAAKIPLQRKCNVRTAQFPFTDFAPEIMQHV